MSTLYDFLCEQPPGGDALDGLEVHVHCLRQLIGPGWMPDIRCEADCIVFEFSDLTALEKFLCLIAERALDCPTMIPYVTNGIGWRITLAVEVSPAHRGSDESAVLVTPTLHLDRAAFVAIALTVGYDNWIERDDERSVLSAIA